MEGEREVERQKKGEKDSPLNLSMPFPRSPSGDQLQADWLKDWLNFPPIKTHSGNLLSTVQQVV